MKAKGTSGGHMGAKLLPHTQIITDSTSSCISLSLNHKEKIGDIYACVFLSIQSDHLTGIAACCMCVTTADGL